MDLVFQTTRKHLNGNLHPEAMIHSDQGFHYTHPAYQSRIRELGLVQSMSRRGNCLDNAPIESFFGHLKDHVEHRSALNLSEVRSMVDSYIAYYNSERKQWNLKKMTPEPSDRRIGFEALFIKLSVKQGSVQSRDDVVFIRLLPQFRHVLLCPRLFLGFLRSGLHTPTHEIPVRLYG